MRRRAAQGPAGGHRRPSLVDVGVTVGAALLALGMLIEGGEDGARAADAAGIGLLLLSAVPLVWRRWWPEAALCGHLALVTGYYLQAYPGGAALPLTLLAIYGVSAAGRRWWTVGAVTALVVVSTGWRVLVEGEALQVVGIVVALLVLVALWGDGVHTRARLAAETDRRLAAAEAEKEAEAHRRVAEERLRLAHELHDVMAHTVTTMTVQAGAATDQLDHDPQRAREALEAMRSASRAAMAELRDMVAVLRGTGRDADRAPLPGLARLDELARIAQEAGVCVEVRSDGALQEPLPTVVDLTGYRVVQEALTNVVRHAAATRATVGLHRASGELTIEVTDDGRGPNGPSEAGFGLVGLGERIGALGGRLETGGASEGGFRLAAVLPVAGRS